MANLCFSLQDAGVPIERDDLVPCLQREYPLISRGIIWWFLFSALPRFLVDLGKMIPLFATQGQNTNCACHCHQGQELLHHLVPTSWPLPIASSLNG